MKLRSLLAHAGLVAGSLVAAALLLEGALRIVYPAPIRWTYPQEYYDFDPEVAHVLRPGQQAFTHDKPVSTNSLGLRDREFAPQPAAGVRRVLTLGDSQTFGNGLALAETWPKQVEALLNASPGGTRWELVNAGVPGTDTWQHEILLERLLAAYHPHAVVLAVYANDVAPRFEPRPQRASVKTNTLEKRLAYGFKRSALVSLVAERWRALEVAEEIEKGHAIAQYIVTGEPHERVERGWQQVDASLAAMKRSCDARGVQLLIAVLPRRDQVSGAEPRRAYNERLAAIAAARGIPALDLLPSLSAAYAEHRGRLFLPWDGHNSALANGVIARRIAHELRAGGALASR